MDKTTKKRWSYNTEVVKWNLIKEEMWLKVKSKLNIDWDWQLAKTQNLIIFKAPDINGLIQNGKGDGTCQ